MKKLITFVLTMCYLVAQPHDLIIVKDKEVSGNGSESDLSFVQKPKKQNDNSLLKLKDDNYFDGNSDIEGVDFSNLNCDLVIDIQPMNPVVCGEREVTFNVSASSEVGGLQYQWQKRNGATSWRVPHTGSGSGLGSSNLHVQSVYVSEDAIYLGTFNGLAISNNKGKTWELHGTGSGRGKGFPGKNVQSVFASDGVIYAGTYMHGLAISTDKGATWTVRNKEDGLPDDFVQSIYVSDEVIYAGTYGGLAISKNKGLTWEVKIKNKHVQSVFVFDNEVYAGTTEGLAISTDKGATWTVRNKEDGLPDDFVQSVFAYEGVIYAGTYNGLATSINKGIDWTIKSINAESPNENIQSIFVSEDEIYVGTFINGLAVSSDGGANWKVYNESTGFPSDYVESVWVSNGEIYAGTGDEGIVISNKFTNIVAETSASYTFNPVAGDENFTYRVVIKDANGCSVTSEEIFFPPVPEIAPISNQSNKCPVNTFDLMNLVITDNNKVAGTKITFHSAAPKSANDMSQQLRSTTIHKTQAVWVLVANTTTSCYDVEEFQVEIGRCSGSL